MMRARHPKPCQSRASGTRNGQTSAAWAQPRCPVCAKPRAIRVMHRRGFTHLNLGGLLADGEAAQHGGADAVRVRRLLQAVLLADERPGGLHEVCTGGTQCDSSAQRSGVPTPEVICSCPKGPYHANYSRYVADIIFLHVLYGKLCIML